MPATAELGVDFGHIRTKVLSVLNITKAIGAAVCDAAATSLA